MTKSELVSAVAQNNSIKKKDAEKIVSSVIDIIVDSLKKGEKVSIAGFGTFEVRQRAEKNAINPATKKPIVVPAKKAPAFKAGKALKDIVNK
ncbi:MAG: HU family DNA-binding protein [Oscillospiraceae bacterium]